MAAWVVATAGAVAVVARFVRRGAEQVNALLRVITETVATVEQATAEQRTRRSAEERALEAQLAVHDEEISQFTAAMSNLDERIAAARASAAALSVGQTLYTFLADRAAGYQRHLGVVGMLHRDFLMLDARLRAVRAERAGGAAHLERVDDADKVNDASTAEPDGERAGDAVQPDEPTGSRVAGYERIVLYIDDLDRCAPDKVLEVLEAVHLLLALPLFVVVVGVDPRWLKRSLRHSYRKLRDRVDPQSDPYLESMPIEYLEKIFQIPFIVPGMTARGFHDLITGLVPTVAGAGPAAPQPAVPDVSAVPGEASDLPSKAALPIDVGAPAASGSEAPPSSLLRATLDGTSAPSVDLTQAEVDFAAALRPLVSSPRAAKRLMNTYRLLRSTQFVEAGSRLLGTTGRPGEHQAILTLLAVAAGIPEEAETLLVKLESTQESSWPTFVAGLDRHLRVAAALQATMRHTTLVDLEPYRRWGPVVARFTFSI